MDSFLSYLEGEKPEWAARLKGAGPADTGSKEGGMPTVWKELADKYPEEFEAVQTAFIRKENYDPARLKVLDATGIDMDNAPKVVQDVLWSTSVQHGATGAARIFSKVVNSFIGEANGVDFNQKLIEGVYDTRKDQFGSSTKRVRNSVQTRLTHEKELALSMLGQGSINKVV